MSINSIVANPIILTELKNAITTTTVSPLIKYAQIQLTSQTANTIDYLTTTLTGITTGKVLISFSLTFVVDTLNTNFDITLTDGVNPLSAPISGCLNVANTHCCYSGQFFLTSVPSTQNIVISVKSLTSANILSAPSDYITMTAIQV